MIHLIFIFLVYSMSACDNYVLVGPPGSGKGTFSLKLVEEKAYKQICPGDILRTHIKNETDLGKLIKSTIENGDYIEDKIIYQIIEDQVKASVNNKQPFIIDGFSRHIDRYKFLLNLFEELKIQKTITYAHFIIEDQICIDRIANRLVCFN